MIFCLILKLLIFFFFIFRKLNEAAHCLAKFSFEEENFLNEMIFLSWMKSFRVFVIGHVL